MTLYQAATKIDAVYFFGDSSGGGGAFTPLEVKIDTPGTWTYTIPAGATRMDVVIFGGGGGGGSSGALGDGLGGRSASSTYATFVIGTDFAAGATVTGYNGKGGAGKTGGFGQADSGEPTTFATNKLSAIGGLGGDGLGDSQGGTPKTVTYNSRVYVGGQGGAATSTNGSNGAVGGGGGGGGEQSAIGNNGGDGGSGRTYLYFYAPAPAAGPGLCLAVYLGDEKVWPDYTANLSQWYSPGNATGSQSPPSITIPWPAGATFCDVIMINGGAGGTGTGIAGNAQKGGGQGNWFGVTVPREKVAGNPATKFTMQMLTEAGWDGVGGGNFNTTAAGGCSWAGNVYNAANTRIDTFGSGTRSTPMTSNTNNRNGGNVAPSFTFNGRTYTLASYGAGAGQGGASSNKNGSDGTRPGGGGQSADNGGLTGYNGGNGAQGAFRLYWY